ncbi:DNA polymerase III subunit gamma/tau [Parvularcula oceani]|uniref:DNA polymerase III subunit gamma/tau n=1 Tax=Parvularcula oceani TaxID=1247963 RepID=UPI00068B1982|nr:DNA polymerase III subunit gamma/tau [Parvularcula oceani]
MSETLPDSGYQVLARKYRPQSFDDLLGHDAMVRTLRNAFAADRIAHAFILTGVRGVGKTTTARIMARALNYETDEVDRPTVDMPKEGRHCRAIAESRHPDVLEMDAASRTGVGDIRELIEGVRYAPVQARTKVYIIDEVHMLSNSAFNALLKTLEEPPPHVKFIFATTEIRKVPVTVLSRCQRFDLRRFDAETLADHLETIARKEHAEVARDGLLMIARAAEGSVRDALSLLDQALIQHGSEGAVTAEEVRDMLGLVDRTRSWDLLAAALKGDAEAALETFRDQYDAGADPAATLRDLLEVTHLLTRVKAAGPEAAAHGRAGTADAERAREAADGLSLPALTRAWSLLMKALDEAHSAPDPAAAAEIGLIRLAFAARLPTPDEALRAIGQGGGARPHPAPAPRAAPAPDPEAELASDGPPIEDLSDIARLAGTHREAKLKAQIERFAGLVSLRPGHLTLSLADGAPESFHGELTKALARWTGQPWQVDISREKANGPTLKEARQQAIEASPLYREALNTFPGAQVTAIRDLASTNGDTE